MKLTLLLKTDALILPKFYNQLLQKAILDVASYAKPKLFSFSKILVENEIKRDGKRLLFSGNVKLVVTSPDEDFLVKLKEKAFNAGRVVVNDQSLEVTNVLLEEVPPFKDKVVVKALSPIVASDVYYGPKGSKKTYYYAPFEPEFAKVVLRVLAKKYSSFFGKSVSVEGDVKPHLVTAKNHKVIVLNGEPIKCWDGIYELIVRPEEVLRFAFACGLGLKTSLGFGCIEPYAGPYYAKGEESKKES